MIRTISSILLIIITTAVFCQPVNDSTKFNLGFEKAIENKELPEGWRQWGKGYEIIIDTLIKRSGKKSVLIQSSKNRTPNSGGGIIYEIPAVYKGNEIELRGYMKMEAVKDGFIGLLLRIDGTAGLIDYENMYEQNVHGTADWTKYSVKLLLPQIAKSIKIGIVHMGTGKLWVDDLELLIDGVDVHKVKEIELKEYPAEKDHEFDKSSKIELSNLNSFKVDDLKILGLVWGFLKYYHPNVAAGTYNWDYELFRILPQFNKASNSDERDVILSNWVNNLGSFAISDKQLETDNEVKIYPDLDWINNSGLSPDLVSTLVRVKNAIRTNEHYYVFIEGEEEPIFTNEKPYSDIEYPDPGFRLLTLYRYWNMIQYYYPYKYLIDEKWTDVLKEFIPKFLNTNGRLEYLLVIQELISRIHDTHSDFVPQPETLVRYWGQNYAPLEVTFIGNRAVITDFLIKNHELLSGLQKGDIILTINKTPVDEIIKKRIKYTSGSNYPTQLRNLALNLLRTNDTILNIEFIRDGKSEIKDIKTYSQEHFNIYKRFNRQDTCFKFITPEIGYIYLGSIRNNYVPSIIDDVQHTKGLIIDLRCYPSEFVAYNLAEYLLPDSTAFVKGSIGNIIYPGLFTMTDSYIVGKENKAYYRGKVLILVNELTQSQAEFTTMAFQVAPDVKVVGSTTAGADGDVTRFYLPGGIKVKFSGIGIYYPDGTETQRVGIIPDIEIMQTIEGIIKGEDVQLEKAIQIIEK